MDDFFNDDNLPEDNPLTTNRITIEDEAQSFMDLVQRALALKHTNFEFIRSLDHRAGVKIIRFGYATVFKMFKKLYQATYKDYVNQIKFGGQDIQTLLALKQFKHCMEFYDDEVKILDDMLEESSEYVFSGHVLDTLMGRPRTDIDLWDHRGRGNNGK